MSDIILAKQGIDPRVVDLATQIKAAQGPERSRRCRLDEAVGHGRHERNAGNGPRRYERDAGNGPRRHERNARHE